MLLPEWIWSEILNKRRPSLIKDDEVLRVSAKSLNKSTYNAIKYLVFWLFDKTELCKYTVAEMCKIP